MNVACDYEAPMQMLTTEKYIAFGVPIQLSGDTLPSFKLKFSLSFITSCYVIFSLSMVQEMDIFMIT